MILGRQVILALGVKPQIRGRQEQQVLQALLARQALLVRLARRV